MDVRVTFFPDQVMTTAKVGDSLLEVARRCGVEIPTGCCMGSCLACEVELDGEEVVCACISSIPPGRSTLSVTIYSDPTW